MQMNKERKNKTHTQKNTKG